MRGPCMEQTAFLYHSSEASRVTALSLFILLEIENDTGHGHISEH